MIQTLKMAYKIETEITINAWIYFLKRIPLIKKLFKNVGYEHEDLGLGFGIAAMLWKVFLQVLTSVMLALIGIVSPMMIWNETHEGLVGAGTLNAVYVLILGMYFLNSALISSMLFGDKQKFICVKLMRMNAKSYLLSTFLVQMLCKTLIGIIIFSIIATILNGNIMIIIILFIGRFFFKIFGESLHFMYYARTKLIIAKNRIRYYVISITIVTLVTYGLFFTNILPTFSNISLIIISVVGIALGIFGMKYLSNYKYYPQIVNDSNLLEDLSTELQQNKAKKATFAGVSLENRKFTAAELNSDRFEKKTGYDYLNAIFFYRHRKILYKPIKIQCVIVLLIVASELVGYVFIDDFSNKFVNLMTTGYAGLVFACYILSNSANATKAMFYNCDISLLRYGFYKKKRALLQTFRYRLIRLIISNLMPTALFGVGMIIIASFSNRIIEVIPIVFMVLVLSCFFAVHNLFLYYIFQPYTTDLNVKNPMFKFINVLTYFLCYMSIRIEKAPDLFLQIVVIATIAYMILALVAVYKFANRTFVIK